MSRLAKFLVIFIIGIESAVVISAASGLWLEYMCTLAVFSVFAAIIGVAMKNRTEDRLVSAGWWTFGVGAAVAIIFGLVFLNGNVFAASFVAAIVWGLVNAYKELG